MKKALTASLLSLILLASPLTLKSEVNREVNLFGGLGLAADHYRGFVVDFGAELEVMKRFFFQVGSDFYFKPIDTSRILGAEITKQSAVGVNFFGVYKFPVSETIKIHAKAGFHMMSQTITSRPIVGPGNEVSDSTSSSSDFGVAGGGGVEIALSESLSFVAGSVVKFVFSSETYTWFRFFGGLCWGLK